MNSMPLSVIIPVYNVAPYLPRCLESILQQTRKVQEIICVDDGSEDESGQILDAYAQKNENIYVIHKENGGLVSARKAGLAMATMPYATYVDSDDWIESEMYEIMMDAMLQTDADVVASGYFYDQMDRQRIFVDSLPTGLYEGAVWTNLLQKIYAPSSKMRWVLSIWSKIYQTSLLRMFQARVDDRIDCGEDYMVTWPLYLHAKRVYETGRVFYHYCQRANSMTNTASNLHRKEQNFQCFLKNLREQLNSCVSRVPNIMEQYHMYEASYWFSLRYVEHMLMICEDELRPFGNVPRNSSIVVYGAGQFGRLLHDFLLTHNYHVVGWVEGV